MAQPDNRKKALQNPDQSWTQNYRDYTGRIGTLAERNNFKQDYVSEENVDARMGEGAYQQMLSEAEQRLFGTRGVTPTENRTRKEQREYDRFKRRFDRNLRNGRLQPRSQVRSNPNNNSSNNSDLNNNSNNNLTTTRMIYSFGHNFPRFTLGFGFSSPWFNSTTKSDPLQKHQDDNKIAEQKVYKPPVTVENKPVQIKATTSDVANIQRKMGVPVTGVWDEVTTEAVKKWQKENGLEQTGLWDETTANTHESQRQAQIRQRLGFEDENAVKQWQIENGYDGTGQLNNELISVWNENQRKLITSGNNGSTQEKSVTEESIYNADLPGFWQSMKEELPVYGTIQSGKRLFQNPSWVNAGDFAGDLVSDVLTFVPGIGWAAKALKAGKAAKTAGKTLKLLPVANKTLKALPITINTQKALPYPGLNIAEEIPYIVVNKKGGRINYFQQGGEVSLQQDIQQQVIQLVQAAMLGDQKATDTVNQIMQAAQQGDQQAVQLALMIQQVVEQMKGQATMAKWGSKLEYIKSLKYAKGGKTCPSCQNEDKLLQISSGKKSTKKVEEKACGGKTKKRYFGGYI